MRPAVASSLAQATTLLTMDKYAPEDAAGINSTCFKLNSLQLQALLHNYHCAPDEPLVPPVRGRGGKGGRRGGGERREEGEEEGRGKRREEGEEREVRGST